jgi:hypothetical protein
MVVRLNPAGVLGGSFKKQESKQGGQIFLGAIKQSREKYTKLQPNIQNVHKIYSMAV